MKKLILPLVFIVGLTLFVGMSYYFPRILTEDMLKKTIGLYAGVIALLGIFLRQYLGVKGDDVLLTREAQRYMWARRRIRKKMWIALFLSAFASFSLWLLSELSGELTWNLWLRSFAGVNIVIGLCLLLAIARWMSDLAEFSDNLLLKEQIRKQKEGMLKRLADAAK